MDVGRKKIEAQTFDALLQCVDKLRFETPKTYEELVEWSVKRLNGQTPMF